MNYIQTLDKYIADDIGEIVLFNRHKAKMSDTLTYIPKVRCSGRIWRFYNGWDYDEDYDEDDYLEYNTARRHGKFWDCENKWIKMSDGTTDSRFHEELNWNYFTRFPSGTIKYGKMFRGWRGWAEWGLGMTWEEYNKD